MKQFGINWVGWWITIDKRKWKIYFVREWDFKFWPALTTDKVSIFSPYEKCKNLARGNPLKCYYSTKDENNYFSSFQFVHFSYTRKQWKPLMLQFQFLIFHHDHLICYHRNFMAVFFRIWTKLSRHSVTEADQPKLQRRRGTCYLIDDPNSQDPSCQVVIGSRQKRYKFFKNCIKIESLLSAATDLLGNNIKSSKTSKNPQICAEIRIQWSRFDIILSLILFLWKWSA